MYPAARVNRRVCVAAATAATTTTIAPSSNVLLFAAPKPNLDLLSVDDLVCPAWDAPPASGLPSTPCWVVSAPAAFSAGAGDGWVAPAGLRNLNAHVAPCFAGLDYTGVQAIADAYLCGATHALTAALLALTPATSATTLRRLCAEHGPALALVAPGGTSALATLPTDLLPLVDLTVATVLQLAATSDHAATLAAALAGLDLLSFLRFGSSAAAAPFTIAATTLRQAAQAAATAGAPLEEATLLNTTSACARADSRIWRTPYLGQRWAAAMDQRVTAGWSSGEAAVAYLESWASLVSARRLQPTPASCQRHVEAVMGHGADLTAPQLGRLLAAVASLPASGMAAYLAALQERVAHHLRRLAHAAQHAAGSAAATRAHRRRQARHAAAATVEPAWAPASPARLVVARAE